MTPMATNPKNPKNRVPVKNRRSDAKVRAAKKPARSLKIGVIELIVLIAVLIIFLLTIALPLRNYFEQRNEIKEVSAAIAQKQRYKEELLGELDRYQNKAYLDEQARNRLGVIAPGEIAFRILDPTMTQNETLTTHSTEEKKQGSWYETLWGSVAHPVQGQTGAQPGQPTPEMRLPVEPTQPQEPTEPVMPLQP